MVAVAVVEPQISVAVESWKTSAVVVCSRAEARKSFAAKVAESQPVAVVVVVARAPIHHSSEYCCCCTDSGPDSGLRFHHGSGCSSEIGSWSYFAGWWHFGNQHSNLSQGGRRWTRLCSVGWTGCLVKLVAGWHGEGKQIGTEGRQSEKKVIHLLHCQVNE